MVVYGYEDEDTLLVADPEPPCVGVAQDTYTYANYSSQDMPGREHWDDFFGFVVK